MSDWAYIRRQWARRATFDCVACQGSGYQFADNERPCWCVLPTLYQDKLYDEGPDPRSDEGQSDARELERLR
jgi:hypothetical protein